MAFDIIDGFADNGHSVTDVSLGNQLRNYLHEEYKEGPITITSDIFGQGRSDKLPKGLPVTLTACEGPPTELAL